MFNLTMPSLIFGTIISGILSAAFHLWKGGNWKMLILYFSFGWFGFWIAHFLGHTLAWDFLKVGSVYLGVALIGNVIGLLIASWLSKDYSLKN